MPLLGGFLISVDGLTIADCLLDAGLLSIVMIIVFGEEVVVAAPGLDHCLVRYKCSIKIC